MAKFVFNADEKTTSYEMKLGDNSDFFKIYIKEDDEEMSCHMNEDEAELLVIALKQYIVRNRQKK